MRLYVVGYAEYEDQMRAWARSDDNRPEPKAPVMPWQLRRYLECSINRCMLVAGGLQDQPHWTWLLIQVAGDAYHETLQLQEEIRRAQQRSADRLVANSQG